MSMKIAHNIAAINTRKNLYTSNRGMNSSLEKLSSGYRINTGQDAPADLVISEQLRAQEVAISRAIRNTTEANNVLTVAEGALNEMNNILKKMKALAVHAANNGVTSPEQVAADQAEMDSGIQTIERIAGTTKFSDQFLLNGQKEITYSSQTQVKGTQNNKLLNNSLSGFTQIFKRDGYSVSLGFNGASSTGAVTGANIADADMKAQASRAYLEIDPVTGTKSQVDAAGRLTQGQSFVLTGNLGSRQFDFSAGAHVSEIVSSINNVAGSTGVNAALTFHSGQYVNKFTVEGAVDLSMGAGVVAGAGAFGNPLVYDNYTLDANGGYVVIASSVQIVEADEIVFGKNTDGLGNIYAKYMGNDSWEYYKDSGCSAESLIGAGNATTFSPRNNSGIAANNLLLTASANAKYGEVVKINVGNITLQADAAPGATDNIVASGAGSALFEIGANTSNSVAAGVQLGVNTDESGKIYIKTVLDANGAVSEVYAYNNKLMRESDMVAKRMGLTVADTAGQTVLLDSIWNDEHTASTGLNLALVLAANADIANANSTLSFDIQFKNVGARVYASEYGSDQFLQVQQNAGSLFTTYENQADANSARVIAQGDTFRLTGQDATLAVNGKQVKTTGLRLSLATQDIQARLAFNAGKTGTTTVAQVGYGEGSVFNKNTSLTFSKSALDGTGAYIDTVYTDANANFSALLNNACHITQEIIGDFNGGMQLQLGEGAGDQNRTIIGVKSMATTNLGRIEVTGNFAGDNPIIETRSFSIQDVMGGQLADLKSNPALAMSIIEQAISDVSEVRATIGAVQANLLQTNENNLRVAVENITKTESDIRDTDMASEMTEFTKNQVLANAGVSMLSQANAMSQNVLQLLQ